MRKVVKEKKFQYNLRGLLKVGFSQLNREEVRRMSKYEKFSLLLQAMQTAAVLFEVFFK